MNTSIPFGWSQTRIFTKNFTVSWYLDLLCSVVIPFHQEFPDTPFWMPRYESDRDSPDEDRADTNVEKLPVDFLNSANNKHRSLRLRYAALADEEMFLDQLIDRGKYWLFDFRGFDVLDGIGNGRFSTSMDLVRRKARAGIFAQILWHHSRLVLDTVENPTGAAAFEENKDSENSDHETVFCTELHLIKNSAAARQTDCLPLLLLSRRNPSGHQYIL